MAKGPAAKQTDQILVRVPSETYAALQLAQPFVERRSMQDLVGTVIEEFLADLRARNPGFAKALIGLAESRAEADGTLARRRAGKPAVADRQ